MKSDYKTMDEYISSQVPAHQEKLNVIRHTVRATVPDAVETLSYQMPAFKYQGMLCFFAVFKDHYSLFVSPGIHSAFATELKSFKTTKSAIHFPLDRPIPVKLIGDIVRFAAFSNLEKAKTKKTIRGK